MLITATINILQFLHIFTWHTQGINWIICTNIKSTITLLIILNCLFSFLFSLTFAAKLLLNNLYFIVKKFSSFSFFHRFLLKNRCIKRHPSHMTVSLFMHHLLFFLFRVFLALGIFLLIKYSNKSFHNLLEDCITPLQSVSYYIHLFHFR